MKHVAVLMGGWSSEREVSLNSGKACADAAERKGYRVSRIDVTRDVATVLGALKPDVALNVLHGRPGEDGTLQGMLEVIGIPYSHSGVLASSLAMQKDLAKRCSRPQASRCRTGWSCRGMKPPRNICSSVPMSSSRSPKARASACSSSPKSTIIRRRNCFVRTGRSANRCCVEKYIPGKELTCAVMGDQALDVIEIVPTVRFYDYEAKYAPGGSQHVLPAKILPKVYQQVRRLSLHAHQALACRGVTRADFRYDDRSEGTEGLACLEVNTQPGMTETSLVPELAAHAGVTFDELVQWMIEDASLNR